MNKMMTLAAVAAAGLCAVADPFEVRVWRGETTVVRVPDFTELGAVPEGLDIRFGVLKPVRYLKHPYDLEIRQRFDRVEWGSAKIDGPRVAEIHAPADAKPGVYACGMMDVRVIDRVLPEPKDWKYYLDLWQHPWASARVAGAKPFTRAHYQAMRPVWELLATAGQKAITTTLVDWPWNHQCRDAYGSMIGRQKVKVEGEGEQWRFDYSIFDEYVEFAKSCGLGPDIACYTMCPWGFGVDWKNEKGETVRGTAKPGTPEFADYWGDFLVDFAAHLKAKGWFEHTYIAMDERPPKDVKAIADFIQKCAPGMKISLAGNRKPSEFVGITIDNYCQYVGHMTDDFLAEVRDRQAKGYITTYYVCCGPEFPNSFLTSWPEESFWLGAYPAMAGLDGFLRWAWNSWGEDPMNDGSYRDWRAGDVYLAYPDGSPSWRFVEIRNGIATAEKVRILEKDAAFDDDLAKLRTRYDYKEAMANKTDFRQLKLDTLKLVNREGR